MRRPQLYRWARSRWLMRGHPALFKDFGHEPLWKPKPLSKTALEAAIAALEERDRDGP